MLQNCTRDQENKTSSPPCHSQSLAKLSVVNTISGHFDLTAIIPVLKELGLTLKAPFIAQIVCNACLCFIIRILIHYEAVLKRTLTFSWHHGSVK